MLFYDILLFMIMISKKKSVFCDFLRLRRILFIRIKTRVVRPVFVHNPVYIIFFNNVSLFFHKINPEVIPNIVR